MMIARARAFNISAVEKHPEGFGAVYFPSLNLYFWGDMIYSRLMKWPCSLEYFFKTPERWEQLTGSGGIKQEITMCRP